MGFYVPRTADGKPVKLPFPFLAYKLNWIWPMSRDSPTWESVVVNCLAIFFLLAYVGTVYAEFKFISGHQGEVANIAECLCTTFIGTQFAIRILNMMIHRKQMKDVVEKFFEQIYVPKSEDAKLHKYCERGLRVVYMTATSWSLPLILIYLGAAVIVARDPTSRNKPYLYRMQFSYDAQESWMYAFTSLYTGWVGFSSVTLMGADECFIGITLNYCALRYKVLQDELEQLHESTVMTLMRRDHHEEWNELHEIFRNKLKAIITKQQQLDRFSKDLQAFLSPTIFIVVTFGTFLLCVVAFQLARINLSIATFQYAFWLVCQSSEFLVLGTFGQRYTDAAGELANSYYMCNWELLLPYGDRKKNSQLIKDVSFAIYRSQKSVHLNGMKFLILSLKSIGSALSSSVSYFMFLNTMDKMSSRTSHHPE